ncbi:tyrosine-type recombinase/integrase [Kineococcus glutinatus]|uniref:Site-specific integrase n=1 Tax=Kineococcus glutinatus TaxID=1070872 RepID=A0ABP9H319_9ACTN
MTSAATQPIEQAPEEPVEGVVLVADPSREVQDLAVVGPATLDPSSLESWLAGLHPLHRAGRSAATWRAYASDLAHFATWCSRQGVTPLPAEPGTVLGYLHAHGEALSLSTLQRRLAAISVAHRLIDAPSPTTSETVRLAWSGLRRTHGPRRTVRKVDAVLTTTLAQLVAPLGESAMDIRDRALLVMGFAGAFRRSELAGLNLADITVTDDGLRISVRSSKTDQEGQGRIIGLPYGSHRATCPVRSWLTWAAILDQHGISEGPAFRSFTKAGRSLKPRGMTGEAIAEVVKRRAAAVGIDPTSVAGHSLRAGFITSAARAGVPDRTIMRQSGHRSPASLSAYVREGTLFQDNAAAHVGL